MSTRRALVTGMCVLVLHAPMFADAQQTTAGVGPGYRATDGVSASAADSAALARARFRAATAAHARGDLDSALRAISAAITAWPTQPAYAGTMALFAARRSDVSGLLQALAMLTAFEAGGGVDRDSAVVRMSAHSEVSTALHRWRAATSDRATSTVYATLSDSALFPEGMDVDARTGTVYVASVRRGIIVERRTDGTERQLPDVAPARGAAILAARIDTAHNVLWATTSGIPQRDGFSPADSGVASLIRIRLADGTIDRTYPLPVAPGGRVLGDVAISPTGDILFTDSQQATLFVLRTGADTLVSYTHALFRSLQGVAPTADGSGAHVADYSHGLLYVELLTGHVVRVADAAGTTTLGIDGIVRTGRDIIAVQNGMVAARIVRLTLDPSGRRVVRVQTVDRNGAIATEPTIGAILGDGFLYVANSQWEQYDARGGRIAGSSLARPMILHVTLPKARDLARRRDPLHLRARDLLRRALRGGRSETGR